MESKAELILMIRRDSFKVREDTFHRGEKCADYSIVFAVRDSDGGWAGFYGDHKGYENLGLYGYVFKGITSPSYDLQFRDCGYLHQGDVEKMHKTMSALVRKLDKVYETDGRADGPAEYMLRVARAAKVTKVVSYNDNTQQWRAESLGDARNRVNTLIRIAVQEINKEVESV